MRFFSLSLVCLSILATFPALGEDSFVSLFNGHDLSGWKGDPALWKVKDGVVVGTCTGPELPEHNTFLIWKDGTVADFELRAVLRVIGDNNSGIQYRSRLLPETGPWGITGYQCDVHPVTEHNGMTYEEKGRGIFGLNGKDVLLDPEGKRWLVAEREPVQADVSQWNEYTIIAQGNQLIHKLNGKITSRFTDHDVQNRSLEGLLAIQLHRGNAHTVEIKSVQLKPLSATAPIDYEASSLPADAKPIEKPSTRNPQGKGPAAKAKP